MLLVQMLAERPHAVDANEGLRLFADVAADGRHVLGAGPGL
jgi:hypothetical protein